MRGKKEIRSMCADAVNSSSKSKKKFVTFYAKVDVERSNYTIPSQILPNKTKPIVHGASQNN